MNTHPQTILWVDADGDAWNMRSVLLARLDLRTDVATSPDEALQLLRNRKYAAVVIGCSFPDPAGTRICRELRGFDRQTPVVLLDESPSESSRDEAFAAGVHAYASRSADPNDLVDLLAELITQNETGTRTNHKRASENDN